MKVDFQFIFMLPEKNQSILALTLLIVKFAAARSVHSSKNIIVFICLDATIVFVSSDGLLLTS